MSADAIDKDEQLKTLESMLEESVETIDVHQEAQELKNIFTHAGTHEEITSASCKLAAAKKGGKSAPSPAAAAVAIVPVEPNPTFAIKKKPN
jgi:DNA-binding protein H-NS